jgi:hypothetical protein
VGVDDQWHSGWSLLLCSVARCLGVGACSQVDYPGTFGCIRGTERQKIRKEVGGCVVVFELRVPSFIVTYTTGMPQLKILKTVT